MTKKRFFLNLIYLKIINEEIKKIFNILENKKAKIK